MTTHWLWAHPATASTYPTAFVLHEPAHWTAAKTEPTPSPVWLADIGGVQVSADQITAAIHALNADPADTSVKPVLKAAGHPLALADLDAVRAQERLTDPTLTGPGSKKKAVLRALHRQHATLTNTVIHGSLAPPPKTVIPAPPTAVPVDARQPGEQDEPPPGDGTVHLDEHGYAVNHHREAVHRARSSGSAALCTAIADAYGRDPAGALIVGAALTDHDDQQTPWFTAFLRGDLKACHVIEALLGTPHPAHPGGPGHDPTHHVTWQPSVPGETPAGVAVPGNWVSPHLTHMAPDEVDAYLHAAHMQHPTGLSPANRRAWVRHHILGHTEAVDRYSRDAKTICDKIRAGRWAPLHDQPNPRHPVGRPTDPDTYADTPLDHWPVGALYTYTAAHQLPVTRNTYTAHLAAAHAHQLLDLTDEIAEVVTPTHTFTTTAPDTPRSGYHRKHLLTDQHQQTWLFKPAPDPDHTFRPETEHEAHLYARRCGYRTADSRLITHDGQYGQAQRMHPVTRDLTGVDPTTLTVDQLADLAREHLLDWAIDNDDAHAANIVELTDGTIVGIDKGRAWRYYGGWPGLTGDHHADTNCHLVYTRLYDAIAAHHIDRATVDAVYRAVHARALRMQRVPDTDVAAHITRAVAHRPHYRPSHYQRVVPDTPTSAAELVTAALTRKNRLAADMTDLWTRIYTRAGWTPPDLTGQLGENNDGARLYTGLRDPDLPHAVTRTKSFGTPTFVAGTDIDDAHLLLWRERRHDGVWLYRGETTLTAAAATRAEPWYQQHRQPTPTLNTFLNDCTAREIQRRAFNVVEGQTQYALERLQALRVALHKNLTADFVDHSTDAAMCQHYLDRIDTLTADIKHGEVHTSHPEVTRVQQYLPPPRQPDRPLTEPWVVLEPSRRPAATLTPTPALADDGELHLTDATLCNAGMDTGHTGNSYWTHLPTGELIEFRPRDAAGVPRASWGMLRFTLNPDHDIATGLTHIDDHFTTIGTPLHPATHDDLELFYFRHLYAVMQNRADTHDPTYTRLHARQRQAATHHDNPRHELDAWHDAFAVLTDRTHLDTWTAAGNHLPRLLHLDLRRPHQHSGRPHWERFDIPPTVWSTVPMPGCYYNSGPTPVITTGAAYSTEARIRTLALWKTGMSSSADQAHGSSNYIFLRLNREDQAAATLLFSPRILIRTSTYGFPGDNYGRLDQRPVQAYFTFAKAITHTGDSNECMVKHALSLLDDVEIIVAEDHDTKTQIIETLAATGLTHIRGIPIEHRIVIGVTDRPRRRALAALLRRTT